MHNVRRRVHKASQWVERTQRRGLWSEFGEQIGRIRWICHRTQYTGIVAIFHRKDVVEQNVIRNAKTTAYDRITVSEELRTLGAVRKPEPGRPVFCIRSRR